jgi:hypothetical protein
LAKKDATSRYAIELCVKAALGRGEALDQVSGRLLGLTDGPNDPALPQNLIGFRSSLGAVQPVVVVRFAVFELKSLKGAEGFAPLALFSRLL